MLDKVPESLIDDIVSGNSIPIIGAGFSRNAIFLPNEEMPDWEKLGRKIAKLIPNYPYSTPLDAISAYSYEYSRVKLVEKLVELLHIETVKLGSVHKAFCELPFDKVCTTNFDFLLEKAYDMGPAPVYCHPVIDQEQLSLSTSKSGVFLLKLHGDLNHPDRLIASEDDYDSFIDRYPLLATYLGNLLITRTPILIGYSLEDPDFRQIWQIIKDRLGQMRRPAYVITVGAKSHEIGRYERRGVKVINLPGAKSRYGEILENFFKELRVYWPPHLLKRSIITDEETADQLSIPKDNPNRLCYFAIPPSLKSFYKSNVFPIVESLNLVPVVSESIISPGDNISAKIMALMDRAQIVVADSSSTHILSEINLAINRKPNPPQILLILEEGSEIPTGIEGIRTIYRPRDLTQIPEDFIIKLDQWFSTENENLKPTLSEEPYRLLEKNEYGAAVISAFKLLEITLQEVLSNLDIKSDYLKKSISLINTANTALENQLINNDEFSQIMNTRAIRNQLVHGYYNISREMAMDIVNSIMEIVIKLKNHLT